MSVLSSLISILSFVELITLLLYLMELRSNRLKNSSQITSSKSLEICPPSIAGLASRLGTWCGASPSKTGKWGEKNSLCTN